MKLLLFSFIFNLLSIFHGNIKANELLPDNINFNVYRNGSQIGFHKINFSGNQEAINVLIEIKFEVTFLGFVVYEYLHRNNEIWNRNSLVKLESTTNINGDPLICNLKKSNSAYLINGTHKTKTQNTSPLPTSYWNKILVRERFQKVLNTQDCSNIDFQINLIGEENIYNDSLLSDHYKMIGNEVTGEVVDIDIWYDKSDQWVKMIFVKDGSTIEYILDKYDSK